MANAIKATLPASAEGPSSFGFAAKMRGGQDGGGWGSVGGTPVRAAVVSSNAVESGGGPAYVRPSVAKADQVPSCAQIVFKASKKSKSKSKRKHRGEQF
jgi:hypothetical protein